MIQTQVAPTQEILPHLSSSWTSNLLDQASFEYTDEGDEEDSQDFYQDDEEETEDYPLVWYHLPTRKPDPKQEKLKSESLAKRNQQIQEKKEKAKQCYKLLQSTENDHVSFKKTDKLPRPSTQARLICYISDKNLLVILLHDGKTVKIYSTLNFKLLAVTKAQKEVKCMSYCKKLGRIIVGGAYEFLQLWNPKTFEVEAKCPQVQRYQPILSVEYAAKSNVIVAKTAEQIRVYNTGLRLMTYLPIPYCGASWYSFSADIFSLSKNLLLAVCYYATQKRLILFNIRTGNSVECSKTAFIPITTSVEMTEKTPVNVFSCLGMFNWIPEALPDDKDLFPLVQFTIDIKNEKLVPVRSSNVSILKQAFNKLNRIKNSKYFLAERFENDCSWKTCLLSINKNKMEVLYILSGLSEITLSTINTYLMLKDRLSVVEVDENNCISVYRSVAHREKLKSTLEDSS